MSVSDDDLLLAWPTRALTYGTREHLEARFETVSRSDDGTTPTISPDMPFTEAIPLLVNMRGATGQWMEYGCFDSNGTLISDESTLFHRQHRNILYYCLRDFFNLSRGHDPSYVGVPFPFPFHADVVSEAAEGSWALLLTDACPQKQAILKALQPLVEHRRGAVLELPRQDRMDFVQWLQANYNQRRLPSYLLICDSLSNVPLEYQYLLNAGAVAGRLWFEEVDRYSAYVEKLLAVERGYGPSGRRHLVASPHDDTVTVSDYAAIIGPMLPTLAGAGVPFEQLIGTGDFGEASLLEAAEDAGLLALYCHGIALRKEEWEQHRDRQGAFVLRAQSQQEEALLTAEEVDEVRFVPGGVLFSPACMGAGNQADSDFVAWLEKGVLQHYVGAESRVSTISQALLGSPQGPIAILGHFDISMSSKFPMLNPYTPGDLQMMLHMHFLANVARGKTIGRASAPFRWAAGEFYSQAICMFGQLTGKVPYIGTSGVKKTVGQFVRSMSIYHVTASDMRNYLILGDPAVRLAT